MSGGSGTSGVTMDDINTLMSQGTYTNTVNTALQPALGAATGQTNALATTAAEAAPAASGAAVDGASTWTSDPSNRASTPWIGQNKTPQTWNKASKPSWMQGSWDFANWGKNAATGEDVPASTSTLAGSGGEAASGASGGITSDDVAAMIAAAQGEAVDKAEPYQSSGDSFIDRRMENMIDKGEMTAAEANAATDVTRRSNRDIDESLKGNEKWAENSDVYGLKYTGSRPKFS